MTRQSETSGAGENQAAGPLLPFPAGCRVGVFLERRKRFSIRLRLSGRETWAHTNNSGSMLGLTRPGTAVLVSPAANPARKLQFTQECVWMSARGGTDGFWVGVNTLTPNRILEAAFGSGVLAFATGYTSFSREVRRGPSRLDAMLAGPGLPPLWVECKNVTLVEDDVACFPDAASERGRKHLRTLLDVVKNGERAAMFYLIQRPDGHCFAPAACIDEEYAALFYAALGAGVEIYPYRALIGPLGVDLGGLLPIRLSAV